MRSDILRHLGCAAATVLLLPLAASAGINPPGAGEEIVYQSVQSGSDYRNGFGQITGNAYTEVGDEVILGGTARYVTNVAVGTQTYKNNQTLEYQPAYLEMSIYLNDGPPDVSGNSIIDSPPHNNPTPGTLLGRSRVPGPRYPEGGVSRSAANVDDFIVNFPFPNLLVPENVTFAFVNLDENGNPDITYGVNPPPNPDNWQQPSFRFGGWSSTASTANVVPGSGGPFYNNTTYNLATAGTSRTGPFVSLANPGQWRWTEYNGQWESSRSTNHVPDATIIAAYDPIFGDMNGDGVVDNFDIQPFEQALADPDGYLAAYPRLTDYERRGDIDNSTDFDNFDIGAFETLLTSGGLASAPAAVPEPSAVLLLGLGGLGVVFAARRLRRARLLAQRAVKGGVSLTVTPSHWAIRCA